MNPHEVLNVSPRASKAEIRSAYLKLARRWHPDRFMEGPERDWANEKMAEINAAYHACLQEPLRTIENTPEDHQLSSIEDLINRGQYPAARRMLMNIATRCAEWNYLFGAMLVKTNEIKKGLIYLSVATHQQPDNAKYAKALKEAQDAQQSSRMKLFSRFRRSR